MPRVTYRPNRYSYSMTFSSCCNTRARSGIQFRKVAFLALSRQMSLKYQWTQWWNQNRWIHTDTKKQPSLLDGWGRSLPTRRMLSKPPQNTRLRDSPSPAKPWSKTYQQRLKGQKIASNALTEHPSMLNSLCFWWLPTINEFLPSSKQILVLVPLLRRILLLRSIRSCGR